MAGLWIIGMIWLFCPVILFVLYMMARGRDKVREKENHRLLEEILNLYLSGSLSEREYYQITRRPPPAGRETPLPRQEEAGKIAAGKEHLAPSGVLAAKEGTAAVSLKEDLPKRKGSAPANVILILGVLFVTMAGLIFATTTWKILPNFLRMVIVLSQSLLFFAVSFFSQFKLKLKNTGMAFYILGCLFLPLGIVAISFFKLLGPEFSFFGRDRYLVSLTAFLLLSLSLGGGIYVYRRKSFFYTSLGCVLMVVTSLTMHFRPEVSVLVFVLTLYSGVFYLTAIMGAWRFPEVKPYARGQVVFCALLSFGAGVCFRSGWSLSLLLADLILFVLMTHMSIKAGGWYRYLHPAQLLKVFWGGTSLLALAPYDGIILMSVLSFAAFFLYAYSESRAHIPLQTFVSDGLFVCTAILPGFLVFSLKPGVRLLSFVLAGILLSLVSRRRRSLCFLLPHLGMLCFFPIWEITGIAVYQIIQISLLTLAVTGIAVYFAGRDEFTRSLCASLDYAMAFYGVLFAGLHIYLNAVGMAGWQSVIYWISFIYWGLHLLLTKGKPDDLAFFGLVAGGAFGLFFITYDVFPDLAFGWRVYALALSGVCLSGWSCLGRCRENEELLQRADTCAVLILYGTSVWTLLYFLFRPVVPLSAYGLAGIALSALTYYMLQRSRLALLGFMPAGGIFFFTKGILWNGVFSVSAVWGYLVLFVLLGAAGRGIFGRRSGGLTAGRWYQGMDWFTIWAGAAIPGILWHHGVFSSCLLLSAYSLLFYNRLNHQQGNRFSLTGMLLGLGLGLWSKAGRVAPGFRITWIFAVLLLGIFLAHYFVWKRGRRTGDLLFGAAVLAAVVLLAEAIMIGTVGNGLFLGITAMALLMLACRLRSRRWFLFAAVTLVMIGLYASWGFWISLAWWIYLLVTGMILIVIGAGHESARTKGEEMKNSIREFFDGWTM